MLAYSGCKLGSSSGDLRLRPRFLAFAHPSLGARAANAANAIIAPRTRAVLALILASGGIGIAVGAVWDELWHRRYGLPFGEDLFWRRI